MEYVARVLINPGGIQIEVRAGESLLEAAERQGFSWPTICGGVGMCTMCWVRVESGAENLSEMRPFERDSLETNRGSGAEVEPGTRLGCQVHAHGDAVVFKRGVNLAGRAGVYR